MADRYTIINKTYEDSEHNSTIKEGSLHILDEHGNYVPVFTNTKISTGRQTTEDKQRENLFQGTVEKIDALTYTTGEYAHGRIVPDSKVTHIFEEEGQGPSKPLTDIEQQRDELGFTHPNLHRRVYPKPRELPELAPRSYSLSIQGVQSFRTTRTYTHDEEGRRSVWYVTDDGKVIDLTEVP